MKRLLIATILLAIAPAGCNAQPVSAPTVAPTTETRTATPPAATGAQSFDFYLLNLSWAPEFCASHPNVTNYAECSQRLRFILHGLWPQNNTGPFIQNCTTEKGPANVAQYADIYPEPGLLQHEWSTHGTCSGLTPDAYFSLARTAANSVAIPAILTKLDQQISLPPDEIIDHFRKANPSFPADSFALSCGNNYLTAIEVCLNKAGKPTSCVNVRSCKANTVRIPPPGTPPS